MTAAVRASVRHLDTGYDALLTAGTARKEARARVSAAIETVLASWRHPPAGRRRSGVVSGPAAECAPVEHRAAEQ